MGSPDAYLHLAYAEEQVDVLRVEGNVADSAKLGKQIAGFVRVYGQDLGLD